MFNGEAGAWGDKELQIGGQMLIWKHTVDLFNVVFEV